MASRTAEYDNIASDYAEIRGGDIIKPIDDYTLYHCLLPPVLNEHGLLTGKRVLDLACGDGLVTRQLRGLDCDYILGADISSELIKLACDIEQKDPKGIEYIVADAKELPPLGKSFDLVAAFYLLNYARTREELLQMVKNVSALLGENKHFIGVTNNIEGRTNAFDKSKYGFFRHLKVPLVNGVMPEGTEILVTLLDRQKNMECTFSTYFLSHKTYEEVFREAGFKKLQWIPYQCDGAMPNKEFYDDFIKNPSEIGFIATK